MSAEPQPTFDELAYAEDQSETALQSIRIASLLGISAFVGFAAVDPFLAPERLSVLVQARVGIVLVLLGVFFSTFFAKVAIQSRALYTPVAIFTCAWIGAGVIGVTALVGGAATNYHEALLLTFFAFAAFPLPWRWQQAVATFAVTVLAYDFVMWFGADGLTGSTAQWITVNAVLWFAVLIAGAITWHSSRLRRSEFQTRLQLKAANERLQKLDEAKTAFFTNISHELRTPLTLVLAPLESLLENVNQLEPTHQEQLLLARRSALRLLRLVDDLLVLSRIEGEALKLYKSSLDLAALTRKLTEEAAELARRKQISVSLEVPTEAVKVKGDEEQLERVLLNLLANALKFTPAKGAVAVQLTVVGERAELVVRDNGPGIPADQLERVFERFHQVDGSNTRRFGGTGIGLSLARQLVQLHDGEIQAEANPGGGTIMRVQLPVGSPSRVDSLPVKQEVNVGLPEWHEQIRRGDEYRLLGLDEATERRLGRRAARDVVRSTLLVIEDNADMVRFLVGVLGSTYNVLAATDGHSGLKLAFERRPDLVLSDVSMPGMTGWEVLARLRDDPHTRSIPVVLLTARGAQGERMQGLAQGADAYLTKPFQVNELLTVIRGLLRNQGEREQQHSERWEEDQDALLGGLKTVLMTNAPEQATVRLLAVLERLLPPRDILSVLSPGVLVEQLPRTGIEVVLSATRQVRGAALPLQRTVAELVDNARRAAGETGTVTVEVRDEGERSVRVSVRDTGPGVPSQAAERVFQPFYSSWGREGMGLAIARRLVRASGGELTLDGQDRGAGASFTIRLRAVSP